MVLEMTALGLIEAVIFAIGIVALEAAVAVAAAIDFHSNYCFVAKSIEFPWFVVVVVVLVLVVSLHSFALFVRIFVFWIFLVARQE